jgi:hypothetical protein
MQNVFTTVIPSLKNRIIYSDTEICLEELNKTQKRVIYLRFSVSIHSPSC